MTGLGILGQKDFSKGMFRNPSPELIPDSGFADAVNALLEEDGSLSRRGGSVFKGAAWPTLDPLIWMWDGFTAGGPRSLLATPVAFGTFAADDSAIINLAGSGTDGQRAASGNGIVFVPQGSSSPGWIATWGGSRKTAAYSTGTITSALLSRTVTGAGTTWTTNVDPGMLLFTPATAFIGVVATVDSNTQITLHDFAQTAVTGGGYSLFPIGALSANVPAGSSVFVGCAGDPARLLIGYRNQVKFSAAGNPWNLTATDYHQMPEGQVVGLAGLQDQAFVFTTAGVYVISNLNYNLIDAFGNVQQRLTQLTKDVICLDARGIAGYRNQLIVPGTDDIWLMGPAQYPVPISDPIRTLYRAYVQRGFVTGVGAVFRNHYILPIIDPNASGGLGYGWVDTLVYRLDQQGWTRWAGQGANSYAFATRSTSPTRRPALLATAVVQPPTLPGSQIMDLTQAWSPSATVKRDADSSIHQFSLTTRDYTTGVAANRNLVKKVRLRYELVDAATDQPVIKAYFGTGISTQGALWGTATWGSFVWGDTSTSGFVPLQGSNNNADGPPDSGTNPFPWLVGQQAPAFFRLKFVCDRAAARLTIREIDSFIRSRSRQ